MGRQAKVSRFDARGFADHIIGEMKQRGMSHHSLAAELQISSSVFSKMDREGRKPSADILLALCHWANVEPMRFHVLPRTKENNPATGGPFSGLT
jgi:hypothetical protein